MSTPYLIPIPLRTFYVVVGSETTDDYTVPLHFAGAQCDRKHKWGPRVYYKADKHSLQIVMLVPLSPTFMNGRHILARLGWTARNETKLSVYEIINIRADRLDIAENYARQHNLQYFPFTEFFRRVR